MRSIFKILCCAEFTRFYPKISNYTYFVFLFGSYFVVVAKHFLALTPVCCDVIPTRREPTVAKAKAK